MERLIDDMELANRIQILIEGGLEVKFVEPHIPSLALNKVGLVFGNANIWEIEINSSREEIIEGLLRFEKKRDADKKSEIVLFMEKVLRL